MQHHEISSRYFEEARKVIPGGVNSPVRACQSVGCEPIFVESGQGCYIEDADGNAYIDYVCSWGPMIMGHCHPEINAAVASALDSGTSFGIPTWREVELARRICDCVPSVDLVRLVNSGTEATMSAIRLARGFTGRRKIVKFDGCYHGHADSFLVKAGSGVATLGIPGSPGIPEEVVANTVSIPFNDLDALKTLIERDGEDIAAVIMEPVPANMGVVLPLDGYLEGVRALTKDHGIVLIFDEVITGFRLALGGAQEYFGITPDLTTMGKIIGGGLPVGAYGGRRDIMEQIAPAGPVYQAGTLSGNPLATAAGLAALGILSRPGTYENLKARCQALAEGYREIASRYGIRCHVQNIGSILTGFFGQDGTVTDFDAALRSDTEMYGRFFRGMLAEGVYVAPSQFEAAMVSTAHTWGDIEDTLNVAESVFKTLA